MFGCIELNIELWRFTLSGRIRDFLILLIQRFFRDLLLAIVVF